MKTSELDHAYVSLWLKFSSICSSANFSVKARDNRGFTSKPIDKNTIGIESLLYLSRWGYRPKSTKRTVDIVVRSSEKFHCATKNMTKSIVQVMYFDADASKAQILLGIHFDFEGIAQQAHPVFHAQLDDTKLSEEEYKTIGFRKTINPAKAQHYSHLRIPTPHMGLGAVLLALSADHLPGEFHNQFLEAIRENPTVKWDAVCASSKTGLGKPGGSLHSHHWY